MDKVPTKSPDVPRNLSSLTWSPGHIPTLQNRTVIVQLSFVVVAVAFSEERKKEEKRIFDSEGVERSNPTSTTYLLRDLLGRYPGCHVYTYV